MDGALASKSVPSSPKDVDFSKRMLKHYSETYLSRTIFEKYIKFTIEINGKKNQVVSISNAH